jgi:hypothetical protein
MSKENWVDMSKARLSRTADWTGEKNMGVYEMGQKDRKRNTSRSKIEKK